MKTLPIYCLLFLGLFVNCTSTDNSPQENSIFGSWQLIEYFDIYGTNPPWNPVDDGYLYTFNEDGTFYSNRFNECLEGVFSLNNNELTLEYGCEGFTTGMETPEGVFVEQITFENNTLILTPTYMNCDEGCGYRFVRFPQN